MSQETTSQKEICYSLQKYPEGRSSRCMEKAGARLNGVIKVVIIFIFSCFKTKVK
jgi:hypothetical protein